MATSITMETSYSGKESTRSITNVNPNASDADIATFTKSLNALTDNTLKKVNRIDKNEIDPNITYYDVKLETLGDPSQNITFDATTNTLTINAAAAQQDTEETTGLIMNIQDGGAKRQITNKPRIIDWAFGTSDEIAIYQMSSGSLIGISYIKSANPVSDQFTITFAGGSFVSGGTAYNYSPFTITFIINA